MALTNSLTNQNSIDSYNSNFRSLPKEELLPGQPPQQKRKGQGYQQAGGYWKVKSEVLALDNYIAGQPSERQS